MKIFIRKEFKKNEYRTPLIPSDCSLLIKNNFQIFFEPSDSRCFSDKEYFENGCIPSNIIPENSVIIGLKELNMCNSDYFKHKNMYFAHCYKNQSNSNIILKKFKDNGGCILDYEYIIDENSKRIIAFGFWAGFAGIYLGLSQYIQRINNLNDLENINPINDYLEVIEKLKNLIINPKIAIVGINGRCGQGCKYFLDEIGLKFTGFSKNDPKNLYDFDIIINCIYLSPESNEIFISEKNLSQFTNLKIIVDVSCDIFSPNNPINLKYELTTFEKPIYKYNNIDIIAIDNLPTLLPKDSSKEFSNKLITLLQNKNIWIKLEELFQQKINLL